MLNKYILSTVKIKFWEHLHEGLDFQFLLLKLQDLIPHGSNRQELSSGWLVKGSKCARMQLPLAGILMYNPPSIWLRTLMHWWTGEDPESAHHCPGYLVHYTEVKPHHQAVGSGQSLSTLSDWDRKARMCAQSLAIWTNWICSVGAGEM